MCGPEKRLDFAKSPLRPLPFSAVAYTLPYSTAGHAARRRRLRAVLHHRILPAASAPPEPRNGRGVAAVAKEGERCRGGRPRRPSLGRGRGVPAAGLLAWGEASRRKTIRWKACSLGRMEAASPGSGAAARRRAVAGGAGAGAVV